MSVIRRSLSTPSTPSAPRPTAEQCATAAGSSASCAEVPTEEAGATSNEAPTLDEGIRLAARERAVQSVARLPLSVPSRPAEDDVEVFSGIAAPAAADDDAVTMRSSVTPEAARELLQRAGYEVGEGSGLDDPTTQQSIRSFQEEMGLIATGELDLETFVALLETSLANDRQRAAERAARNQAPGGTTGVNGTTGAGREQQTIRRAAPVDVSTWQPGTGDATPQQLQRIVPGLSDVKAREVAPHLNRAMAEANIDTPQRKAAFIAQVAHESGGFEHMMEMGSGSRYEGRRDLGNIQPGDGERFKGRGLIQITGRANYAAASRALGEDFVNHPERAATPENAARIAAWFWNSRGLNAAADRGDFAGITRRINGGQTGAAERAAFHGRALDVLKDSHGVPATGRLVEEPAVTSSAAGVSRSIASGERGAQLAQEARAVAERMNSVGACAKGVGDALRRVGINQRGHAYQHAEMLARRSDFREVSVGRDELRNLPAGAVIVWGRSNEKPFGHVAVALGNGLEASDHVQRTVTNGAFGTDFGRGPTDRQFRVFIPRG